MQIPVFRSAFVFNRSYWATIRALAFLNIAHIALKKGLDGEIKSLLGSALACDECGLQRPDMPSAYSFLHNNPHSLAFCGFLCSWMGGGHDLNRPIYSTKFLAFSTGFLSCVSWWVKTLLHFEAVINPAL